MTKKPYLLVQTAPQTQKMDRWQEAMLHRAGIPIADVEVVNLIAEEPEGSNEAPTVRQLNANAAAFSAQMRAASPRVIIPMGPHALRAVTGLRGKKWGIDDLRGYVLNKRLLGQVEVITYGQVGVYKTNNKARGYKIGDPKMGRIRTVQSPPLPEGFDGVIVPTYDARYMQKLGLKPSFALRADLERARHFAQGKPSIVEVPDYLTDPAVFASWKPQGPVAFDIETPMDSRVVERISFSDGITTFSLAWDAFVRVHASRILGDPKRIIVAHNSPFDVPRLREAGTVVEGIVFDTMLAGQLIQPDLSKGLGRMASLYLNAEPWKAMSDLDPVFYSAKDAYMTIMLYRKLIAMLDTLDMRRLFEDNIMPAVPVLTALHERGMKVDRVRGAVWLKQLEEQLAAHLRRWTEVGVAGVSPTSPPQLKKLFYDTWGMQIQRNKEDGVTTDELALANLEILYPSKKEVFDTIRAIRNVSKLIDTYATNPLDGDSKVHPTYLPESKDAETPDGKKRKGAASTGRLGTSRPNIQNQPPEVRVIYIPDHEGWEFDEYDFVQAELYSVAALSKDEVLGKAILSDVHQHLADKLGIKRKLAKMTIYGSLYLGGPVTLANQLKKEGEFVTSAQVKEAQLGMAQEFKKLWAWQQFIGSKAIAEGFLVNPFGRIRMFYGGSRDRPEAVDFMPQSIVADIMWIVLPQLEAVARKYGGWLTTTVHDSFLFQFPKGVGDKADAEIRAILEQRFDNVAPGFFIPVDRKHGPSWGELEKV